MNNEVVVTATAALHFGVSERAIRRDIKDLRNYLESIEWYKGHRTIRYDSNARGYRLIGHAEDRLSGPEIFAIIKVLLESRAFPVREMNQIIAKLTSLIAGSQERHVREMIRNELFLYVPLQHNEPLFDKMWDISAAIREHKKLTISYEMVGQAEVEIQTVEPHGLLFSEFYFYLVAYPVFSSRDFPTVYRLDRIKQYEKLEERFHVEDRNRFQEGEFRKRVQFMLTGKLMNVKFRFFGDSLEAVLDRLPNATVTYDEQSAILEAQVYGRGITRWLLSQADQVKVLGPLEFRQEWSDTLRRMLSIGEESGT